MQEFEVPSVSPSTQGGPGRPTELTAAVAGLRPINRLPKHAVDNIVKQTTLYQASVGETLINRVSDEKLVHYLLEGTVQIFGQNGESETLISSDPNAKNALGRFAKSAQDIVANCPSTLVRIPWEALEKYLIQYAPGELSSTLEVQEILSSTSSDWMVRLLQSDLFSLLPASNIQTVLSSIEFEDTLPDEIVITEGDSGEHFYIVDHGQYLVSKQNTKTGGEVELAHLGTDDFFGEEALITGAPRGATVTSLDNGRLIKINSDTFKNSIVAPAVPLLSADHAKSLVGKGASYLDIRAPEQTASGIIPNSARLMLSLLRSDRDGLDKQQTYVVIDDTPTAAAHAAFLLRAKGYDAHCLNLPLQKYAVLEGIELAGESGQIPLPEVKPEATAGSTPSEASLANTLERVDSSETLKQIDVLNDSDTKNSEQPAPSADYAHTLTGVGLADLIEELNHAYDAESVGRTVTADVTEQILDSHLDVSLSASESVQNAPETGYDVTYVDDGASEAEERAPASEHPLNEQIEAALKHQKETLTAEYEQKLRLHAHKAKNAIRTHKLALAREYRDKQLHLLENGKKLIALANKVSHQKAEIQRMRQEFAQAPRLVDRQTRTTEASEIELTETISITALPSANNDSWSDFLRTAKNY